MAQETHTRGAGQPHQASAEVIVDAFALVGCMTVRTQAALKDMATLCDCTVETSDGMVFELHKSVLAEASIVLRYVRKLTSSALHIFLSY